MPSFADTFIQEAFRANAAAKDPNAGSGFKLGAEIAQHAEQVKMQQVQVQQKQQELEQAKLAKLVDFVKDARNYQNAGDRNRYLKGAVGLRNTLGIRPEVMPDEQIASFGSDENMGRIASLEAAIGRGELTMTDATAIAADPQRFGAVVPIPADAIKGSPDLNEAQKQFLDRQSTERAAQARAGQAEQRQVGTQTRFDQGQKTKLADKVTALGIPGLKSALGSLDSNIPGGIEGYKSGTPIPGISGADAAIPMNRLKGAANKVRGDVMSVGNQIIKLRTGAAMTEAEAMRLMTEIGLSPTIGEGGTWTGLAWKGTTSEASFINGMRRAKGILGAQETIYKNAYTPEVYDSVVPPDTRKSDEPKFDVNGHMMTKAQMQKFVSANPKDPAAAVMRKHLGGK